MSLAEVALPLILVAIYFVFAFFWMMRGYPRLENWTIRSLGNWLGVKIVRRQRFRSIDWVIDEKDKQARSWERGCFVLIVQMGFTMGCIGGPIFFALFVMVTILFIASGG